MTSEQLYSTNPKRTRTRKTRFKVDDAKIVGRVLEFYTADIASQDIGRDARVQREAKLRLWAEDKDWPWPGASNVAIPDILEKVLRAQDTLINATMANRPCVNAVAVNPADREREKTVDNLLDFQFFVEQPGEKIISDLAIAFTNDPCCIAYVPWVREKRNSKLSMVFDAIPAEMEPVAYFQALIAQHFPTATADPQGTSGWDWNLVFPEFDERGKQRQFLLQFYTREGDGRVEAVRVEEVIVYEGPRVIPKDYDDVLAPPRCANLQPPSASNPFGASHVILVDYPTADEVVRLAKAGYYDLTQEQIDAVLNRASSVGDGDDRRNLLRDDLSGASVGTTPGDVLHRRLTRLLCFDTYDIDGSGVAQDVVWWVIKETEALAKRALLSDIYPSLKPQRPLAEASYISVFGRREGICLPELVEGLHDATKAILDQTIDAGTIGNVPWGGYRPQSSINAAPIAIEPGTLYPMDDPQRDLNIVSFNNGALAFGANMLTLLGDMEERVTVIGEFQLGKVPSGSSSALRTQAGIQALSSQGASRPERILRRWFDLLVQIGQIMHTYDKAWLPKQKQILVAGMKGPNEDPYIDISDRFAIAGEFTYSFQASIYNSTKQARAQALQQLLPLLINPLTIQLGSVRPDGIYRALRDLGKDMGADIDRYISPPTPGADQPQVSAEEVILAVAQNQPPVLGFPMEPGGWPEHLQKIQAFIQTPELGFLSPEAVQGLLAPYLQFAQQQALMQMQQLQAAAGAFQQQAQGGQQQTGRPAQQPPQQPGRPQISGPNEMLNENLPSAGGGAQK